MLPIAVLPVAGLLLRLGQPDLLNIKWIASAGDAKGLRSAFVVEKGDDGVSFGAPEKKLGINEHVHTVWEYAAAFRRAGLAVRRIERAEGWPPVPYGGLLSRIPKLGLTLGTLVHLSAAECASASIYARKRG